MGQLAFSNLVMLRFEQGPNVLNPGTPCYPQPPATVSIDIATLLESLKLSVSFWIHIEHQHMLQLIACVCVCVYKQFWIIFK